MLRLSVDRQGRVTIPGRLRRQLGIAPGMELVAEPKSGGLLLRPPAGSGLGASDFSPMSVLVSEETRIFDGADCAAPEAEGDGESVISGATMRPAERRKILGLLAG